MTIKTLSVPVVAISESDVVASLMDDYQAAIGISEDEIKNIAQKVHNSLDEYFWINFDRLLERASRDVLADKINKKYSCETTPLFWDCECGENYIHLNSEKECPHCSTCEKDRPDSRISDVEEWFERDGLRIESDIMGNLSIGTIQ